MNTLSACVITLNEERNLPRVLRSVDGIADEVVVVDCGSDDRTLDIAREHGAKVFAHPWSGYSNQKNFAAQEAAREWILSLDADEEVSPELRTSLLAWKRTRPEYDVYEFARRSFYLGGWISHSGWYPDRQRRLFRRGAAKFSGMVHEALRFNGVVGRLKGDLLHYPINSMAEHHDKVERYSTLAARQMRLEGKRNWRAGFYLAAPWSWVRSYIIQGGFLDGDRGRIIARMACLTVRLKYRKLGQMLIKQAEENNRQ
ncbi:MAG TPA: glycosyltransferase family 2 protein [Acidobacteriota bacterium]|nr:glycosyltransferase family 2 protein [Acidobacteriota bacterium]